MSEAEKQGGTEPGALIVLTRQEDPSGAAVWFVTDQVSQIVPSYAHQVTGDPEAESFTDIFFKNGLRVTVKGSPDEVVQSFTTQPIIFDTATPEEPLTPFQAEMLSRPEGAR